MPTQGDPDLFSDEKQFDISKFNRAEKTINERLADQERRKSMTMHAVLGLVALIVFVYLIIPSSDTKKVKKRTHLIIESLNGKVSVLDLPQYIDAEVDTDISVMGYSYRENLSSEAFASAAKYAVLSGRGFQASVSSDLSVEITENDPFRATVEGIVEASDGGSRIQAKFRMKMRKDPKKGWILTSVYSRVIED
ncbi:MAG: hypothetical protein ABIH86_04765 [Planctomycetota bacterium]